MNESDIVICSDDATFFDSHVTFGLVSAIEPVGTDAPHRPRRDTAHRAQRELASGVTAETALRIGLVTEVVARSELWDRADEIARTIAA